MVPLKLPPRLTLPLLAVVAKDTVPEEAKAVVVVRVLSLLTDTPENVSPPEARLNAPAPLFTTIALPVVLSVKLGVNVLILPISPEPLVNAADVVPATMPAV